ncbi:MAG: hypothetical protein COA99_19420 [Moraxellaceae bacterium]|nr:MAG: hypothetical protein COA99_19420 [Moraxellaceae bacterium]
MLRIKSYLTALNTKIGYYKAAEIANTEHENGCYIGRPFPLCLFPRRQKG